MGKAKSTSQIHMLKMIKAIFACRGLNGGCQCSLNCHLLHSRQYSWYIQWPYSNGSQATTSDNTDVDHRVWPIDAWRPTFPIQLPTSYWRPSWCNIWESNRRKRTSRSAPFECLSIYCKSRAKGADWTLRRWSKYSIDKAESDSYHPSRGRAVGVYKMYWLEINYELLHAIKSLRSWGNKRCIVCNNYGWVECNQAESTSEAGDWLRARATLSHCDKYCSSGWPG